MAASSSEFPPIVPLPKRGAMTGALFAVRVMLAGVALLCGACRNMSGISDDEGVEVGRILNSRRAASLRDWRHRSIRGEPVRAYILLRTALVLPPGFKMTVRYTETPDHVQRYDALFAGRARTFFAGCAVPVTTDGYFLTAAHCVEEAVPGIVVFDKKGELKTATTRVVWRGRESEGDPDLALLYAPLEPAAPLPLAGLPGPPPRAEVLTAGFGSHGFPDMRAGISGGEVLRLGPVQKRPGGVRWRELAHSAPTAMGDSGGPVIDTQGRLQGITSELRGWRVFLKHSNDVWFYRGIAICPDADWIGSLVMRDRAAMARGKVKGRKRQEGN